jgi:hypothetical protein
MSDLKNRIRYTNSIDIKLLDWLKEYSRETKIPVSKLLDKSIELLKESTK